jgi:hypothetical protein
MMTKIAIITAWNLSVTKEAGRPAAVNEKKKKKIA